QHLVHMLGNLRRKIVLIQQAAGGDVHQAGAVADAAGGVGGDLGDEGTDQLPGAAGDQGEDTAVVHKVVDLAEVVGGDGGDHPVLTEGLPGKHQRIVKVADQQHTVKLSHGRSSFLGRLTGQHLFPYHTMKR